MKRAFLLFGMCAALACESQRGGDIAPDATGSPAVGGAGATAGTGDLSGGRGGAGAAVFDPTGGFGGTDGGRAGGPCSDAGPPPANIPPPPRLACAEGGAGGAGGSCDFPPSTCLDERWLVYYDEPHCVNGACVFVTQVHDCGCIACRNGGCSYNFTVP